MATSKKKRTLSSDDFNTKAARDAKEEREKRIAEFWPGKAFEVEQGQTKFYSHIDNPIGYTKGRIEVIEFIEDKQLNLHLGNAVQYIVRSSYKGGRDDLKKAIWYLQREIYRQERELR